MVDSNIVETWQYLGNVTPQFEHWIRYPIATNSRNPLIKVTFYDENNFQKLGSFGYLRVVYETPTPYYSKWTRIYPSFNLSVLSFPFPQELLLTSETITRYFEIMKRNKYSRPTWSILDTQWSCSLESLDMINPFGSEQLAINQAIILQQLTTLTQTLLPGE